MRFHEIVFREVHSIVSACKNVSARAKRHVSTPRRVSMLSAMLTRVAPCQHASAILTRRACQHGLAMSAQRSVSTRLRPWTRGGHGAWGHVSMGETMLTRHPCHQHGQGHATTAGASTRRKRINTADRVSMAKSMSTRIGRFANVARVRVLRGLRRQT